MSDSEKLNIVIVEDEKIVALDMKVHLEGYGFNVPAMYSSGEELLENISIVNPSLILMDIQLQGELDGVETACIVREKHQLPVIIITAYADENTINRAIRSEPFGYLVKPFEDRELWSTIEMAIYKHKMERRIQEREYLFQITLNSIREAVVVTDKADRITFANPSAANLIGVDKSRLAGSSFEKMFRICRNDFDEHIIEIDRKDIHVEINKSPLIGKDDVREGTVWVLTDVTRRKMLEKQLQQSQKMEAVGRLAGGVAHDFNNLLTVIMGYCSLMEEDMEEDNVYRNDLVGIKNASKQAVGLTRQLLLFSRNNVIQAEIINLGNVLTDMEKMIKRLISDDIDLMIYLEGSDFSVFADQNHLEQVIMNLVVNARDAMPEGGNLSITLTDEILSSPEKLPHLELPAGNYIKLEVKDTGIGMSEELQGKIFEPFYTTKGISQGTGLGLSIVYGIISQTKGFIDVFSSEGKGSSFIIYFPSADSTEAADKKSVRPSDLDRSLPCGSETILIVEDEDYLRSVIFQFLLRCGYNVIEARNSGEALILFEQKGEEIDLVLSDLIMPLMDGNQLIERLKKVRQEFKYLLMTGYPDDMLSSKNVSIDKEQILHKPFEMSELSYKIRSILDET